MLNLNNVPLFYKAPMSLYKAILVILLFLVTFTMQAQVGIGTTTPDGSAKLDVSSTNKGFLPPRMTTLQRDAITSPATGLQIYNTDKAAIETYTGTTGNWFTVGSGKGGIITNTALGVYTLYANSTGGHNTASGDSALFANTTGSFSTALGGNALNTNTTGTYNTAIGYNSDVTSAALTNATAIGNGAIVTASNAIQLGNTSVTNVNTSGTVTAGLITYPNTAGTNGQVLTTNGSSTATWTSFSTSGVPYTGATGAVNLGAHDLTVNGLTIGLGSSAVATNTAIGNGALAANTTGSSNTAIGNQALKSNTLAGFNTAIGASAMYANTTGAYNAAIGYEALRYNTTGQSNTANGYEALRSNTTGSQNTAIGNNALYVNTTGCDNIATGYMALFFNTTGNQNIANGTSTLTSNTTGNYNTANGVHALTNNTTGYSNTADGDSAMYANTTGSFSTALGGNALNTNTTGTYNTAIGYNSDVTSAALTNATAIGNGAIVTASNAIQLGNSSISSAKIQVAWTITSDKRWKSNIQNSNLGLDFISKLRPVSYFRNNDESKKLEYGFIAQELEEALNHAGVTNNGIVSKDSKGMYGVRYNDLMAPMVKAIQEQQTIIEAQQKQIDELKQLVETLIKK